MKFMAQFDITSDVSITNDAAKRSIQSPNGDFSLVVREVVSREGDGIATFRCNMECESEDLEHSQQDFMEKILCVLDIMSLVTHATFAFHRLHKVFDWTSNKTMREGLMFIYDPPESSPDWALDQEFFETANLLQYAMIDNRLLSALRWFRLGVIADTSQEQFQNFWFALELLAQYKKRTKKIHDACPTCGEALYCKGCDTYPMHRPYPIQEIESVFQEFAPNELGLFQIMNKARNKLMHGVPASKIEAITDVPLHQMIDPLAQLTWRGLISEVIATLPDDKRPSSLKVGVASTFVKWDLTGAANITAVIPLGPNGTPDIELLTGISAQFADK